MKIAAAYNRRPIPWLRGMSERRVKKWIMERQEADGSWGGIQPPWIYSIIALHTLGLPLDHPVLKAAIDGFDDTFALHPDGGERLRIQACLSPIWDTCLAAVALADAGAAGDDPALRAAVRLDAREGGHPDRRLALRAAPRPRRAAGRSSSRTSGTPTPTTPPRC